MRFMPGLQPLRMRVERAGDRRHATDGLEPRRVEGLGDVVLAPELREMPAGGHRLRCGTACRGLGASGFHFDACALQLGFESRIEALLHGGTGFRRDACPVSSDLGDAISDDGFGERDRDVAFQLESCQLLLRRGGLLTGAGTAHGGATLTAQRQILCDRDRRLGGVEPGERT